MSNAFNSGPQAPERNPAITPQYYYPNLSVLQSITPIDTFTTRVVTAAANQFVVGQLIRFVLPQRDGMYQINESQAYITSISNSTTFIVALNTLNIGTFNPNGTTLQKPFVIPVGDVNTGQINSMGRINNLLYIGGSFKNISPI